ncbi:MAG: hypothetical protein HFJ44_04200 [Clostridia bacterium]|jgi:stage III sporulation protein AB|nr:hypothetical protein [Clostridia bacterium]
MILKILLGIGIIFCSCKIGILISKKYIYRLDELEEMKNNLQIIENKIKYTYEPLEEIFIDISEISSSNISMIFKKAASNIKKSGTEIAWKESLKETETALTKEDKSMIEEFSTLLGKTNKEGQINQIKYVINLLDIQIEKARIEREKNEKIYKKLGLILGIGLVIIIY